MTINRGLLEGLDAQMQAIRDGGSVLVLTPGQAGEVLKTIRKPSLKHPPTGQTHGLMDGLRFGRLPTSPRFSIEYVSK